MIPTHSYPRLEAIKNPADLRRLPKFELPPLASEIRAYLVDAVSRSGGHLAAGLGAVELTIALHHVFNTPDDRIVWDVGHQSYPHKILTGRREQLPTIRSRGGLSPFPKRTESSFDSFGVGHAGTSISAALGMAIAAQREGRGRKVIAVIGDGALTAGMAFEALNHAGELHTNLLIILNDNDMSVSPNVGALSNYFAKVLSGRLYSTVRAGSKKVLGQMPPVWKLARRAEEYVKGMIVPGTLFEELGFNYIGPIDGHDLSTLVTTLTNLKSLNGPQFLHMVTHKGKGYLPAEKDPVKFHGIGPFDPKRGTEKKEITGVTYTNVFADWVCDMARLDERLMAITPAMREGSGLTRFAGEFPERFLDVGIAEQHAVTLGAGLACEGLKPVVAIYSTFLQRGYDQVIHDIALQNLPVLFAIDRAGLVGPDGPTHGGNLDISFLRCVPNLVLMAPADENECRQMLFTGFSLDQPSAVRYPRDKGPGIPVQRKMTALPVGKAEVRKKGKGIALLAFGSMVAPCLEAAERINATVVNMRFIKPLDEEIVLQMAAEHDFLVTVEENVIAGGAGSGVNEYLLARGGTARIINHGFSDHFFSHGSRQDVLTDGGLDVEGILRVVSERCTFE
uniref:1-deoxy-D-xylulose-5-phosphate synthase n=1 Tax=Candidatus Kentrum sp. FM TaxID=2126340 RepID=A0A450WDD2_9GAMM|nr:MAG: 1-deoxy-D-xylulose-5-phosphate synthase [Candidatus Kentron sp. FM]VFJ64634.1 MAG: 1-deoxy-D-xylulose-5-phosphate synthase [Candidatus Kentron sp. FM]VFK14998.1 MAG: 1-deoxy-D-xylulose-5-phosphate synthase [Candidatus Kentron sp. FM]